MVPLIRNNSRKRKAISSDRKQISVLLRPGSMTVTGVTRGESEGHKKTGGGKHTRHPDGGDGLTGCGGCVYTPI